MLPQSKRIPRKLFPKVNSGLIHSKNFLLRTSPSTSARFAVSVSKKVSKSSVMRNRVRRRVYAVLKDLLPEAKNNFYLFSAKPGASLLKGEALKREIAELIKKS